MTRFVYVGSETREDGKHRREGITVYRMDATSGKLDLVQAAESGETPSFLAFHPNRRFLYAINEVREGRVTAFAVDPDSGALTLLNSAPVKGLGPCYVSVDPGAKWVLVANYGGGSVSVLPILADGQVGPAVATDQHQGQGDDPKRQEGPHAHSIITDPAGKFVLSADLGTNRVYIYWLDEQGALLPADPPWHIAEPGAGPRHMAFHPNQRFLYVANELNNTVSAYRWDADQGSMAPLQSYQTLPEGYPSYNLIADIHLTPDGRFLYVSNRGHDSLAVFQVDETSGALALVGNVSTGGKWPRNFTLDPEGNLLIVANQESSSLVFYRINPETGMPETMDYTVEVYKPMFVTVVDL
jgi:6-phosphogluconolactonase